MPSLPAADRLAVWRALLTIHADLTEEFDRALKAAGAIPLRWYDALFCLYEAPDRRLPLSRLGRAALLSRSGISRLVDRLEDAGLLERVPSAEDGRVTLAALTPAGLAAMRRAWRVYGPGIQEHFARHLAREEVAVLGAALRRVHEAMSFRGE